MKWNCESVECVRHAIPEDQYQAQIAELAKILYAGFRQLETQDENPAQSKSQADSTKHPFPKTTNPADGEVPSAA